MPKSPTFEIEPRTTVPVPKSLVLALQSINVGPRLGLERPGPGLGLDELKPRCQGPRLDLDGLGFERKGPNSRLGLY